MLLRWPTTSKLVRVGNHELTVVHVPILGHRFQNGRNIVAHRALGHDETEACDDVFQLEERIHVECNARTRVALPVRGKLSE